MADILVVEDDHSLVEILEEFLDLEGHVVRTASNGLEGLLQTAKKLPDLILLDVDMPLMTGLEMSLELYVRDAGQDRIPILLLSGTADLVEKAKLVGTPYYLSKPYRLEQLTDKIKQVLSERIPPERLGKAIASLLLF